MRRIRQRSKPTSHSQSNDLHLWDIRTAITTGIVAAISGLAILTLIAWLLLRQPGLPHAKSISLHDSISVLQLVFASVAGAGALVGLIVAYRRQKVAEADSTHDRTRVYNERFTSIATQLGDDKPAVRLAGVHAMAGLADDWKANRQTCIDVLCAYLRMPYEPDPGDEAPTAEKLAFQASREVRHTVIRVIAKHLKADATTPWHDQNFDFTGVIFDSGNFFGAVFSGDIVSFSNTEFPNGTVSFIGARFPAGRVSFHGAKFSGGTVYFSSTDFSGGTVSFSDAQFSAGRVVFNDANFSEGLIDFNGANFSGGTVSFDGANFSGSEIHFLIAYFSGGKVDFTDATFSRGGVNFGGAEFLSGTVGFRGAKFSGGHIDLIAVHNWSAPPQFDQPTHPAVRLPPNRSLQPNRPN
jgi:uncharacterized protein YjbI with pentapeptide repeats